MKAKQIIVAAIVTMPLLGGCIQSGETQDDRLREVIEKAVRIYRRGNQEKRAHLIGFLNGADPGRPYNCPQRRPAWRSNPHHRP